MLVTSEDLSYPSITSCGGSRSHLEDAGNRLGNLMDTPGDIGPDRLWPALLATAVAGGCSTSSSRLERSQRGRTFISEEAWSPR